MSFSPFITLLDELDTDSEHLVRYCNTSAAHVPYREDGGIWRDALHIIIVIDD